MIEGWVLVQGEVSYSIKALNVVIGDIDFLLPFVSAANVNFSFGSKNLASSAGAEGMVLYLEGCTPPLPPSPTTILRTLCLP